MTEQDSLSYLLMFCALMLVRKDKATFDQSMRLVPLTGSAHLLAQQLRPAPEMFAETL